MRCAGYYEHTHDRQLERPHDDDLCDAADGLFCADPDLYRDDRFDSARALLLRFPESAGNCTDGLVFARFPGCYFLCNGFEVPAENEGTQLLYNGIPSL